MLDKKAILDADDLPKETVSVPEWGGDVCVRALTGTERDSFEASLVTPGSDKANLENLRAKLCAMSICDAEGHRIFSNAEAASLGAKSAVALNRVFEVAQRLSGLTKEDVDTLVKNSSAVRSGDSTSG